MFRFLSRAAARKPQANKISLNVESLEDRMVPAVSLSYGNIIITETSGTNTVAVNRLVNGAYQVIENGVQKGLWTPAAVFGGHIYFTGGTGNDTFTNNTNLRCTATGGKGNDTLIGGSNLDDLRGGAGIDKIFGMGGEDYLFGDAGDDTIYAGYDASYNYVDGGDGNDTIYGGLGFDNLFGKAGNDTIWGYDGDDTINGGLGNDKLYGENGMDTIYGGDGNDILHGGHGEDYLFGEAGNDTLMSFSSLYLGYEVSYNYLNGGDGNDTLIGSDGYDYMLGGNGKDKLYGNGGDDYLHAGWDGYDDTIYGGAGRDTAGYEAWTKFPGSFGDNWDTLLDASPEDTIFNNRS